MALVSMAIALVPGGLKAHEIRPTIADVAVSADQVTLTLTITLESFIAGIDLSEIDDTNDAPEAAIYDQLRALDSAGLTAALEAAWPRLARGFIIEVEGRRLTPEILDVAVPAIGNVELPRDSILTVGADLPRGSAGVSVGLSESFGTFIPRQVPGGEGAYEGFLDGGELTPPLPRAGVLQEGPVEVLVRYIGAGFEHIVPLGLDHILFVLGLFFFALHLRPLLWQVSAFTLAHTVTLALAATGVVSVPAAIVEPMIAATIVYIGIENSFGRRNVRNRTLLVFAFGLLHGLGFASVLGEYGIASGRFVWALVGFNIGVELGQLAVLAGAFLMVGIWFGQKPWYRRAIAVPASLLIGAIGLFWFIERTFLA